MRNLLARRALRRFLVEANHVATRIAESGRNFRRIGADRLNDLASVGGDQSQASRRRYPP